MIFKACVMSNFKGKVQINIHWLFQTLALRTCYDCNLLCFFQLTFTEICFSCLINGFLLHRLQHDSFYTTAEAWTV